MLPPLAQLNCTIEMVAVAAGDNASSDARPAAIEHVIDFQDALSGEPLTPSDVAVLSPGAFVGDAPLAATVADASPDGTALRRVWTTPAAGSTYTFRIDGSDSQRYFGCERSFPIAGAVSRRVRVSVVPRSRDVSIAVVIARGTSTRTIPDRGVRAIELRAAAESEREVDVRQGRCSGERPSVGSHWCVRSLAAEPRPFRVTAMVPGYGLAPLTVDPRSSERTIALSARYEGHFVPSTTLRAGVAVAVLNGNGPGALVGLEVAPGTSLHGQTCPLADTCVRPIIHAGFGQVPYGREALLLGPGARSTTDGTVTGSLWHFELGGGVTVVPAGTGDSLRASAFASAVLGARGDESTPVGSQLLSAASARLGASGDLMLAWRLAGPLQLFGGARVVWFPDFGGVGRRFTFLGDAAVANGTASLVQVVLQAGIGIEP